MFSLVVCVNSCVRAETKLAFDESKAHRDTSRPPWANWLLEAHSTMSGAVIRAEAQLIAGLYYCALCTRMVAEGYEKQPGSATVVAIGLSNRSTKVLGFHEPKLQRSSLIEAHTVSTCLFLPSTPFGSPHRPSRPHLSRPCASRSNPPGCPQKQRTDPPGPPLPSEVPSH